MVAVKIKTACGCSRVMVFERCYPVFHAALTYNACCDEEDGGRVFSNGPITQRSFRFTEKYEDSYPVYEEIL